MTARCSTVCGMTPSSAATTSRNEVDTGGAGHHGAHEALVAGHVDDADPPAAGQLELGIAELDRDAALALLAQAVGVGAGQAGDERRLAVVDVTGGAQGERRPVVGRGTTASAAALRGARPRRRPGGRPRTAAARSAISSSPTASTSSSSRSSWR